MTAGEGLPAGTTSLTDQEERVLEHLDEAELTDTLVQLVRVPSVSGTAAEVDVMSLGAELLAAEGLDVDHWCIDLDELSADPWFPGVEVERDEAWGLVGTTGQRGGSGDGPGGVAADPALVLQGHLDIVPIGDPDAWHGLDPFSGEVTDGLLHGRGAVDMKAGVAANIAAVRTLRAAGVRLARPLAVHCVIGEEDGGLGGFATLRRGHRGEGCVITEPTAGRLVTANAGALTFRIEVFGRSAHGSLRKNGVSALEMFWPVHQALLDLEAARNTDVDPVFVGRDLPYALSVGTVSAGDWSSSVPDRLVAEGRYGVRLGEDMRQARTAFEDAVTEACLKDPWLREARPVVTWPGGQFASGSTDPDHPLVGELGDAARAAGASVTGPVGEVYGSDLRLYTGVGGIPTVTYGPGDPLLAHAPRERVPVDEVVQVTRALVVLALRRCG